MLYEVNHVSVLFSNGPLYLCNLFKNVADVCKNQVQTKSLTYMLYFVFIHSFWSFL